MMVFVVIGSTGEYSEREEFPVIAFDTQRTAEEYIRLTDGGQREIDWDERVRYSIAEIEYLTELPKWNSITGEFE